MCVEYIYIYIFSFRGGNGETMALPRKNIETWGGFCLSDCKRRGYRRDSPAKENGDSGIVHATGGKLDFACFPAKHLAWSSARSNGIYSKT